MIRLRVTRSGGGAWSTAVRYHPFNWCLASWWSGGSNPISFSTSLPASSDLYILSLFKIDTIARPNLQKRDCSFTGYWRVETLFSASLNTASDIHMFSLASQARGFGTALRRAAKIPSSLVGVVGGWRWSRLRLPNYLAFSLREALRRQPRTKEWSELCLGSRLDTFQNRRQSAPRM